MVVAAAVTGIAAVVLENGGNYKNLLPTSQTHRLRTPNCKGVGGTYSLAKMTEFNVTESILAPIANETLALVNIGKEVLITAPTAPVTATSGAVIGITVAIVSALVAAFLLYGGVKAWKETVVPVRQRDATKLAKYISEEYPERISSEKIIGRVSETWCG